MVQDCSNSLNLALCDLTCCCSWFLRCDLSLSSNLFSQRTLIKFAISSKWKSFPPNYRWWKIRPFCLSRKSASIIVCWVVEWVSNNFAVSFCVLFLVPETFLISITVNKSHALKHPYLLKFIEVYYNISRWSSENVLMKYYGRRNWNLITNKIIIIYTALFWYCIASSLYGNEVFFWRRK